ncbi:unnamed protein product [Phaedon cochleariae]|uniref:Uncharacterized protein n=1 Tax=Phaedon cochleariae TaxID=80249 RepID=A0A9P0DLW7_PHACE|nr:unnamed protein product [Phaedon cochleariae]
MHRILILLLCPLLFFSLCFATVFDPRVITKIRHGIEKSLHYIEENVHRVNVDCLFGVVLTEAIMQDVYMNGSHIMDASSKNIIDKSMEIVHKAMPLVPEDKFWIAKFILVPELWQKEMVFKKGNLYSPVRPNYRIIEKIYESENVEIPLPNSDFCLHDISVWTSSLTPKTCRINKDCWDSYYGYNNISSGYTLTHKLLLLQLARARKCLIDENNYERETMKLCSSIFAEVFNGDYFHELDDIFDLFLEQVVLCGYEGYSEFFTNRWLHYILKSQEASGCFSAILTDNLKTRIKKRNMNIFEDGCVDHTTGLGAAALSLYYNFIIKESSVF